MQRVNPRLRDASRPEMQVPIYIHSILGRFLNKNRGAARSRHMDLHEAKTVALPEGWEQVLDEQGSTFYVNHNTQETSWNPPMKAELPPGWEERKDDQVLTELNL